MSFLSHEIHKIKHFAQSVVVAGEKLAPKHVDGLIHLLDEVAKHDKSLLSELRGVGGKAFAVLEAQVSQRAKDAFRMATSSPLIAALQKVIPSPMTQIPAMIHLAMHLHAGALVAAVAGAEVGVVGSLAGIPKIHSPSEGVHALKANILDRLSSHFGVA